MMEQIHCSCQLLHSCCAGETDLQELEQLSWRNRPRCSCNFGGAVHHDGVNKPLTKANSTSFKWFDFDTNSPGKCNRIWVVVAARFNFERYLWVTLFDCKRDQLGWSEETNKTIEIYISGLGENQVILAGALNSHYVCPNISLSSCVTI